jgi:hypothetical protein
LDRYERTRTAHAARNRPVYPPGRSAQEQHTTVKLSGVVLDMSVMQEDSPTPGGLFSRIAAAFAAVARYAGGSLVNHPLPEVREVGHEWRA